MEPESILDVELEERRLKVLKLRLQRVTQKQIAQVRGFADQLLRKPENAVDPSNRRISLIVQYIDPSDAQEARTAETVKSLEQTEKK